MPVSKRWPGLGFHQLGAKAKHTASLYSVPRLRPLDVGIETEAKPQGLTSLVLTRSNIYFVSNLGESKWYLRLQHRLHSTTTLHFNTPNHCLSIRHYNGNAVYNGNRCTALIYYSIHNSGSHRQLLAANEWVIKIWTIKELPRADI